MSMRAVRRMSTGRKVLTFVAGATAVGGFLADWNRTHLFNPSWPPHARFHDAQTISLGALLGTAGLVALHLRQESKPSGTAAGALLPAFFWGSMGTAFLFPGAQGLQSEFPERIPRIGGVWIDERFAAGGMLGLVALGYLLEVRGVHSRGRSG